MGACVAGTHLGALNTLHGSAQNGDSASEAAGETPTPRFVLRFLVSVATRVEASP